MTEYATGAKAGGWGDLATYTMMDAGAQHVIDALDEQGVDASLSRAARDLWRKGAEANSEVDGSTTVYELIRGGRR